MLKRTQTIAGGDFNHKPPLLPKVAVPGLKLGRNFNSGAKNKKKSDASTQSAKPDKLKRLGTRIKSTSKKSNKTSSTQFKGISQPLSEEDSIKSSSFSQDDFLRTAEVDPSSRRTNRSHQGQESTRNMRIRFVKTPASVMMMKPVNQSNLSNKPIAYSVKTLTPLERSNKMNKLKSSDIQGGFVNINHNYFDFHRPLYSPALSKSDAVMKVVDDKLMEMSYVRNLASAAGETPMAPIEESQKKLSRLKIQGGVYKKSIFQQAKKTIEEEDEKDVLGIRPTSSQDSLSSRDSDQAQIKARQSHIEIGGPGTARSSPSASEAVGGHSTSNLKDFKSLKKEEKQIALEQMYLSKYDGKTRYQEISEVKSKEDLSRFNTKYPTPELRIKQLKKQLEKVRERMKAEAKLKKQSAVSSFKLPLNVLPSDRVLISNSTGRSKDSILSKGSKGSRGSRTKFTSKKMKSHIQQEGELGDKQFLSLPAEEQWKKNLKALRLMQAKMKFLVIKDNEKLIQQTEEDGRFYNDVRNMLQSVINNPALESIPEMAQQLIGRGVNDDAAEYLSLILDYSRRQEITDQQASITPLENHADIFNNLEVRAKIVESLKLNRQMRLKVQKALQLMLAKFEELQEMRRIQMSLYSMSPRSFNSMNRKLHFLQELCQMLLYKLKEQLESSVDILDHLFKVQSPEFNAKNPMISTHSLESLKVLKIKPDVDHMKLAIEGDPLRLTKLHDLWLESIDGDEAINQMEENKNTIFALEQLVKKQDGVDEEGSLMHNLAYFLHKRILNMSQFKVELYQKELAAAEQKNQFKGFKCEKKPTALEISVAIKQLQLKQNYFDQSQRIIAEQQQQLSKQIQKYVN